jgi:hypothetical protein
LATHGRLARHGLSLTMPLKRPPDVVHTASDLASGGCHQHVGATRRLVGHSTDVYGIVASCGSRVGVRSAVLVGKRRSALAALADLGAAQVSYGRHLARDWVSMP